MTSAIKTPAFVKQFSCLGESCEDTCCKGWGMQVDQSTADRYAQSAPELLQFLSGTGESCIMQRDALTDYCVKFENGLCGIQKRYGETFLGDACFFYPRMTRALGQSLVMTGALSCPEITRLALFGSNAFEWTESKSERLPQSLVNYLPDSLSEEQAFAIHNAFIAHALSDTRSAARSLMQVYSVAESLENLPVAAWPDAVPFYLEHADSRLQQPEPSDTDPFFLLQALCGLIAAAKKGQQERLMRNVRLMETALHVTIQWDTLAIAHLPDSRHAARALEDDWNKKWDTHFAPLLRRYLAAQLSLALFPFAGLGDTLANRMAIIGVRFATVRLALMSACRAHNAPAPDAECVATIQSLSRFLDHLAGAEFSLSIYKETGWLKAARLRALVGDFNR